MFHSRRQLLGRVSGILFVLMFLADVVITPGEPDPDSGLEAVASYYVQHGHAVTQVALLHTLGGLFFLFFLGFLAGGVAPRAAASDRVVGYSGVVAGALGLVSYATAGAAAELAAQNAGAAVVAGIAEVRYVTSSFADLGLAVMLAACVGLGGLGRIARTLGAVAAALLLAGVLGTFGDGVLGLAGFVGTLLFAVWVIVVALLGHHTQERTSVARVVADGSAAAVG